MINKRGQGLSTNAIILIILGVVVLAVLAIGFTMGWSKFAPWMSKNNIDDVISQCSVACSLNQVNDFCEKKMTVKFDGTKVGLKSGDSRTCKELSDITASGIQKCPSIPSC